MLSSLLKYGTIIWLEKPLIFYRIHASRLSAKESIPERLALINYMKKKGVDKHSTNFILFRILFWAKWILQQENFSSNINHRRYRVVILSILLKLIKISVRGSFWKIISKKIVNFF